MTYKEFVSDFLKEKGRQEKLRCTGCGQLYHLSISHLIKRSKRKDLEMNNDNVTIHCLSIGKKGCHDIWESNKFEEMISLKDFWDNMKAIKKLDSKHYNFLVSRFIRQGISNDIVELFEKL